MSSTGKAPLALGAEASVNANPILNRHFEASTVIRAPAERVFAVVDNHARLSGHMAKSSWMMGGGRMDVLTDAGRFQQAGSHLRMAGRAFGITVTLDEVVTLYDPPRAKVWQTIGEPRLVVIGCYRMGFEISNAAEGSVLRIFIDYQLPPRGFARVVGYLLGPFYARWCVNRMLHDASAERRHET